MHLGNAPEWVAAVGTAGSLAAALWLLWHERRKRHQEHEESLKQQARRVFAYPVRPAAKASGTLVRIRNLSEEPVYDVDVYRSESDAQPDYRWMTAERVLPPDTTKEIVVAPSSPIFEVVLTDSAGLRWHRRHDGSLVRVAPLTEHERHIQRPRPQ